MKTKLLFILIFAFSIFANAQEINCADVESQLGSSISEKDFVKANDLWITIKTKCAAHSQKSYLLGAEVLQYNIDIAKKEGKENSVRELIKLYDLYDKNFPENTNGNNVKRAMALHNNHVGNEDEIYNYLDKAFNNQKATFTDATALDLYFRLFYSRNKTGKIDLLLEKYNNVVGLCDENTKKDPEKKSEYVAVISNARASLSSILTCDNLIPFAQSNFEANKNNSDWLLSTAKMLSERCRTSPIFETIAKQLHSIAPSSKSAYYLAIYNINTKNQEQGINYFTESISLETDKLEKAKTAYTVAFILSISDKVKAKEMLEVAMENNPNEGKYYLLYANIYSYSVDECGTSPEEKKAIYVLASNTALKAIAIDSNLETSAKNMSRVFLKNAESLSNVKNKSVKIGCWINQTVEL